MKSSSVFLLLGVSVLLLSGSTDSAVSLSVSPNLQQFFKGESSLTLSCDEDGRTADGWTVKRTKRGQTGQCGGVGQQDFGRIEGSNCIISRLFQSDSGVYWCERSGERSEEINIIVTDLPFKLEIPAVPVLTGSDVTLRCRTNNGSTPTFNLLKNGDPIKISERIRSDSKGEFIISNVQQSDEGLYSCSVGQTAESARSRLRVKGSSNTTTTIHSVTRLLCHLVVISPYCISSVLMVSIYRSRRRGNRPAISMATSQRDGGDQESDGEYDDVTTEHDF